MQDNNNTDIAYLIEKAKNYSMTAEQVVAQRRSFAFGNSAFENSKITREMVAEEAEKLGF